MRTLVVAVRGSLVPTADTVVAIVTPSTLRTLSTLTIVYLINNLVKSDVTAVTALSTITQTLSLALTLTVSHVPLLPLCLI